MRFRTLQDAYEGMRYELRMNGSEVVAKSSKGDSKAIELLNQSITIEDLGFDEHNRKDAIITQYQDDLARSQEDGWPYED